MELLTLNQKAVGSSPTGITKESQVEEVSVRIREVGWSWRYPLRVSILFFLQIYTGQHNGMHQVSKTSDGKGSTPLACANIMGLWYSWCVRWTENPKDTIRFREGPQQYGDCLLKVRMPPCEGGGAVSGSVFHPRGSVRSEYDKITYGRDT